MNRFTIKDIENLSGIKAHTLRIWERRYGIIVPKRKESNQRFYDNEDLKQVLRITHLYHSGYKISSIANMQPYQVSVYETTKVIAEAALINILVEAAIEVDELLFSKTLIKAINIFGVEECLVRVVFPYFEKIGMLWMNNEAMPAQERFASNIILKKIINEIDKLGHECHRDRPSVILFTPPREYHEIPLLFMHYLLKKNHHRVHYLGTNASFDMLDAFIKANKTTTILFFHVITNLTHATIDNYVKELTQQFNDQTIVMSGRLTPAVTHKTGNLKLLRSLNQMIAFGKNGLIR